MPRTHTQAPRRGVVVITGGGQGIGAAIGLELARRGSTVVCVSRSGRQPEPATGLPIHALACDVTDEALLVALFSDVAKRFGSIGGLVNSAGIYRGGRSDSFSLADFETLLRTNTIALFSACRLAYPHLKRSGGGTIVNIGSIFERLGAARNACYSASKAAVGAITRALASEWGRDHIAVVDVAPGYVDTGMTDGYLEREDVKAFLRRQVPLGRPTTANEVARIVGMLFEEDAMLFTGQTLPVDGGHGTAHGHPH